MRADVFDVFGRAGVGSESPAAVVYPTAINVHLQTQRQRHAAQGALPDLSRKYPNTDTLPKVPYLTFLVSLTEYRQQSFLFNIRTSRI